jgi:hypothetical protein
MEVDVYMDFPCSPDALNAASGVRLGLKVERRLETKRDLMELRGVKETRQFARKAIQIRRGTITGLLNDREAVASSCVLV